MAKFSWEGKNKNGGVVTGDYYKIWREARANARAPHAKRERRATSDVRISIPDPRSLFPADTHAS